MQTAYITHPDCLLHQMTEGHPEDPSRLSAIEDRLKSAQLWDFLKHFEAPLAEETELSRAHCENHILELNKLAVVSEGRLHQLDPDTFMNRFSHKAALRAAGAGRLAVDLVMSNEVDNAFCAVRPPGHHATLKSAMGFCLFNNIAIAARHAQEIYGLQRIAIVDFDVHHGNGTEDIFKKDPQVMLCSTFEYPLYPYSGLDFEHGHLINTPLKAGSAGPEFRMAVQKNWLPELEEFKPEIIFISAGFDAHWKESIAHLQLTEDDFKWVTRKVMDVASRHCEGRIVSMLEGGYDLDGLAKSVEQHLRVLMAQN